MSRGKASHMNLVFASSLLSLGTAVLLYPKIMNDVGAFLSSYMVRDVLTVRHLALASFSILFVAGFFVFSFLGHHVTFSLKTTGVEKVRGSAPLLARLVLVMLIFAAGALLLLTKEGTFQEQQSLQAIIDKAKGPQNQGQGYTADDRKKLENLIHEGTKHE